MPILIRANIAHIYHKLALLLDNANRFNENKITKNKNICISSDYQNEKLIFNSHRETEPAQISFSATAMFENTTDNFAIELCAEQLSDLLIKLKSDDDIQLEVFIEQKTIKFHVLAKQERDLFTPDFGYYRLEKNTQYEIFFEQLVNSYHYDFYFGKDTQAISTTTLTKSDAETLEKIHAFRKDSSSKLQIHAVVLNSNAQGLAVYTSYIYSMLSDVPADQNALIVLSDESAKALYIIAKRLLISSADNATITFLANSIVFSAFGFNARFNSLPAENTPRKASIPSFSKHSFIMPVRTLTQALIDVDISKSKINDMISILCTNTEIKLIFFNGKASATFTAKHNSIANSNSEVITTQVSRKILSNAVALFNDNERLVLTEISEHTYGEIGLSNEQKSKYVLIPTE